MSLIRPPTQNDVFIQTDDIFVPRIPGFKAHTTDADNLLFAENNDRNIVVQVVGVKVAGNMKFFAERQNRAYAEYVRKHDAKLEQIEFVDILHNANKDMEFFEYIGRVDKEKEDCRYSMCVALVYFYSNNDIYRLLVGSPLIKHDFLPGYMPSYKDYVEEVKNIVNKFITPLVKNKH